MKIPKRNARYKVTSLEKKMSLAMRTELKGFLDGLARVIEDICEDTEDLDRKVRELQKQRQ